MKTLAKIIKHLLFGPSLEDYEARQKAETEAAVQAMRSGEERWKKQARRWAKSSFTPMMLEDERRAADISAILKLQADAQRYLIQQQAKGILKYRSDNDGSISVKA